MQTSHRQKKTNAAFLDCYGVSVLNIDLKTDNLDRVSIPRKIVATFDVEHPIHGTTYGPK